MERAKSKAIRQFIIENINKGAQDIGGLVEKKFGISRQAVNEHCHFLIEKDMIISQGNDRNRKNTKLEPVVRSKNFFSL